MSAESSLQLSDPCTNLCLACVARWAQSACIYKGLMAAENVLLNVCRDIYGIIRRDSGAYGLP